MDGVESGVVGHIRLRVSRRCSFTVTRAAPHELKVADTTLCWAGGIRNGPPLAMVCGDGAES